MQTYRVQILQKTKLFTLYKFDIVHRAGLLQTDHSCLKFEGLAAVLFVFLDWAGDQSLDLYFYYWQEAKTKEKQNSVTGWGHAENKYECFCKCICTVMHLVNHFSMFRILKWLCWNSTIMWKIYNLKWSVWWGEEIERELIMIMSCNEGAGEAVQGQRWIYAGDVATNFNFLKINNDRQTLGL